MASYSLQSTQFNLLGRVENVEENSDGSYTATCTIPSSAAPLYEAQLNNLYSTINSLYSQVDGKEGQRNTYLRLITALRDYEIYQTVVLTLNPSSSVATKVLPTTRAIIENEYQSLLIIENNNTEITVRNLQQQAEMGILSVQGRADLNAALKELEENRRQQEELNAEAVLSTLANNYDVVLTDCDFKTPSLDVCLQNIDLEKETFVYDDQTIHSPYEGMYSMYNCAAVIALAQFLHIDIKHVLHVFQHAPQPKGRNEHFKKDQKECILNYWNLLMMRHWLLDSDLKMIFISYLEL